MPQAEAVQRFRPGPFLAVNLIELIERLAYYGALSVTSLYLASLGYPSTVIGPMLALLLPLPYLVNLVVGPLADRHGYKPTMLVAFAIYTAGFLLLGLFTSFVPLLLGIVLVGVGAGVFKPVPAATIALTTTEAQRNLGFSVYYWAINLGAFVGPILIAFLLHGYRAAFFLSAAMVAANLVLVAVAYRDPRPTEGRATQENALRTFLAILSDTRFLLLLVIYSGFWFVYSMNFSFVPLYLADFVALPSWFTPNLQQSIDPGVVILLSLPLGALVSRMGWPPLRVMAVGIALATVGFAIVGFTRSWELFVLGIVVMSIGEILTFPGFLSLVSKMAPPGKAAAYQSAGFLPLGLGFFLGPLVTGFLYSNVAKDQLRPTLFWALVCSIGFLTVAALLLYLRAAGPRDERTRAGATAALGAVAAAALLVLAGAAAGRTPLVGQGPGAGPEGPGVLDLGTWTGTTQEGATSQQTLPVPAGKAGNLTLTLTWSDATPPGTVPGTNNAPDGFDLGLRDSAGRRAPDASGTNPPGQQGTLRVTMQVTADSAPTALISLTNAGDFTIGPAGTVVSADTANDWTLKASFTPAGS
ncbi:MAG TPA: MFS transporter [Candidatus Thermoplasmatota archaeon]|nr:MFS transporter [Candidatus Thermoplasmatota archaeon]